MSYSKLIESFNAYHEIRPAVDLRQQLSTMHSKLTNLHERAKLGLPEDEPVESAISQEEEVIGTLKSRTDDLSKISVSVLKYYSNKTDMTTTEQRFYNRYVKPSLPFL